MGGHLNKVGHPYDIKLFYPSLKVDEISLKCIQKYKKILVFSEDGWENSNFGDIKAQNPKFRPNNPKNHFCAKPGALAVLL